MIPPDLDAARVAAILAAGDAEPALPCEPDPVVNGLHLRKTLGRKLWGVPRQHGCCGWVIDQGEGPDRLARVIVTGDHQSDTVNWIHASISYVDRIPEYEDLKLLHAAVFGERWAYQVFAPPTAHINIHANALHLYGRTDGQRVLPDFGRYGTI